MRSSPYGHPPAASTSGTAVKYQILAAMLVFVDYVSTSNLSSLTAASTTLDGATVVEGKLVALVGQTTASENGVYVADSVSGSTMSLVRVPGLQSGDKMAPGDGVQVGSGAAGAGRRYRLTGTAEKTIGTDSMSFEIVSDSEWTIGTALTDTATTTVQRGGRKTSFLLAGTMSQGETITLGTTGAQKDDIIRIIRTSTSAQTCAVVNGGAGAGTLVTLVASKVNFAEARFDGTNWLFHACGSQ